MKKLVLIATTILLMNTLNAQEPIATYHYENNESAYLHNPRFHMPFGINLGVGHILGEEHPYFLLSTDYFLKPQINLQVNAGLNTEADPYFSAGVKFHLNSFRSKSRFTPYTGLLVGAETGSAFLQVPVGVNYISPGGLNVALGINQMFSIKERGQMTMLELSLGWRLKR